MDFETCQPDRLPLKEFDWERILPLIGDARAAVARLDEWLRSHLHAPKLFESLLWQEARDSVRPQGIDPSLEEVFQYAFTGIAPEKKKPLFQKIVLAKEALDAGLVWSARKKLGIQFFCHIHSIAKRDGLNPKDIGRLRDRQNWIGNNNCRIEDAYFYPPRASRVKPLLRQLETYLGKKEKDPLVQVAIAFAQFLIIHPFMDGNGRVARIFIPLYAVKKKLLCRPILFLSGYFESHRLDYYQKLFEIPNSNAWEEWVIFFLKGVILQTNKIHKQLNALEILWRKIAALIGEKRTSSLFKKPFSARKEERLIQEKVLIARGERRFLFKPLIRAMRKN